MSVDPAPLFREAAGHRRMFWLDGGGARSWSGRCSLLGRLDDTDVSLTYDASAREVRRHRGDRVETVGADIFAVLEEEIGRDRDDPSVVWVGYLGYACRPDLPALLDPGPAGERPPDAVWMRARDPLVLVHPATDRAVPPVHRDLGHRPGEAIWRDAFDRVQEQLRLGNSYEVNLTYRERLASRVDPVSAYLRLRELNPAPYAGFLRHDRTALLSSSPERFATVDPGRWLETRPIKGTTPRAADRVTDRRNRSSLADDPRYRAENLMVVDLLRNDLAMVCEPGTVSVPSLMAVESYPSVHQLVSTVRGRLLPGVSTVAALRALFPAGSMTGAPKLRTMRIIAEVEASPRGVYSGAFGWIRPDGRADLGVVIRSLVATESADRSLYELGTGGGITVHSDADTEFEETLWKSARLRAALEEPGGPAG